MARQIIVLEQDNSHGAGSSFRAVFWLIPPVSRQPMFANPNASSAVHDGSVSAAELTAIQDGSVVERVFTAGYPPGMTLAAIEADLVARYADAQNAIVNQTSGPFGIDFSNQSLTRYGSFYDGTVWTIKNNIN